MTAKPQSMAGQADTADDLIAELAKLMAQDAQTERPAEAPVPSFSLRIPGDTARPAEPAPPQPAPPAPADPAPAAASETASDPFHFDFGLASADSSPPRPAAASAQPEADGIADLIAANLAAPAAPQPAPVHPVQPAPAPEPEPEPAQAPLPDFSAFADAPEPQPAASSGQDRFHIPPVFGLASRPAQSPAPVEPVFGAPPQPVPPRPAPAVSRTDAPPPDTLGNDPIDEIENLIGRAMHVGFEDKPVPPPAPPRPAPSPALRSLATPTLPVTPPAPAAPAPRQFSGADEAILAAVEASGADVGWVDAPIGEAGDASAAEMDDVGPAPRRGLKLNRALAGPLVAVGLLLAAGIGLYLVLGLGTESGPAPLLTAEAGPVKEVPPANTEGTAQQSVVFNEIEGVVPGAEEQLVSRDQADIEDVAGIPPATEVNGEGLANRKVRTVTVRPDGTIVSGEDSLAGSAILPVDRPANVPEIEGADTTPSELLASTAPAAPTPEPAAPAAVAPAPAPAVPLTPGSQVPAVDLAGNAIPGKTAPAPFVRPATFAVQASPVAAAPITGGNTLPPPPANSFLQPVAAAPAAAPTAVPQAIEVDSLPNNAPAYVQLASQRSEAEARASAEAMVRRFGPLFGGANLEVQRVDLGERGIYYRVRVPASSRENANSICTNVKAAGGDCFIM